MLGIISVGVLVMGGNFVRILFLFGKIRSYLLRKYPIVWREFIDSGRIAKWIPTNACDMNILRSAAENDDSLAHMIQRMERLQIHYRNGFIAFIIIFLCLTVMIVLAAMLN